MVTIPPSLSPSLSLCLSNVCLPPNVAALTGHDSRYGDGRRWGWHRLHCVPAVFARARRRRRRRGQGAGGGGGAARGLPDAGHGGYRAQGRTEEEIIPLHQAWRQGNFSGVTNRNLHTLYVSMPAARFFELGVGIQVRHLKGRG